VRRFRILAPRAGRPAVRERAGSAAPGNRETLRRRALPAGGTGRGTEGSAADSWVEKAGRRGTGEARQRRFIDWEQRIWPRSRGRLSRGSIFFCLFLCEC
jgi:hypothetical protein